MRDAGLRIEAGKAREESSPFRAGSGQRSRISRHIQLRTVALHPWGSTLGKGNKTNAPWSCSAGAGIYPPGDQMKESKDRLPRTRGDFPEFPESRGAAVVVAPHARGFRLAAIFAETDRSGCPACAGICRTALQEDPLTVGFPPHVGIYQK